MRVIERHFPTIGFLSTWSVYEGTTIDHYTRTLLQGICAAARDHRCNLLLACGIGLPATPRGSRTAWAIPSPTSDFVPVGPWNTDGLIIVPDDFTDAQFEYVQDLIRAGFPLVMTTPEKPGPIVAVDNAGGIRQAIEHLVGHGHRQIAFVAGKSGRGGDSAERLAAYRDAVRSFGLAVDDRLIAFGEHRREDGRHAMQQILATDVHFTAVLASNDLSALGAMEVLAAAGRRIPEDVAVIGFDDILDARRADARSHLPSLTTVRHPTFTLGYQALLSVLAAIDGRRTDEAPGRVPVRLVIRQSCGCRAEETVFARVEPAVAAESTDDRQVLARLMAAAVEVESEHATLEEIETPCLALIQALSASLLSGDSAPFDQSLLQLVQWLEDQNERPYAWHAGFSTLRAALPDLLASLPGAGLPETSLADALVDRARLEIAEQVQRQATDALLRHMERSNRLGLMTSQLLATPVAATPGAAESANVLARHLPHLGLQHVVVALYTALDDDPLAETTVLLDAGLSQGHVGRRFATHAFPPPELYDGAEPVQLAILPFVVDEHLTGFAAFGAADLDVCAAVVHNLAAAVRMSRLYHDAVEGRQLAEEANRLKSRFLSMVSHELRVPLSLIVGLSDMVVNEQREKRDLSDTTLRDIQQINSSAQHLAHLIGDVLDLASSEAGQLRIFREPLDLAEVLHVAATIGEQMAHDKGLVWSADLPDHGPWIVGDRTRLGQVALNLISNAIKFTPTGTIALGVRVDGGSATVCVSDTGIGISSADRSLLFREFQRTERTVESGYGGMGLGLAISKHLVEQHGGAIGVSSPGDLGAGSTFYFTLPIMSMGPEIFGSAPLAMAPALVRYGDAEAEQRIALIVDDDPNTLDVYSRLVERIGCRALRARNGREALDMLAYTRPDLILLDLVMPVLDGFAVLEALRASEATRNIPVIVLTAHALSEADVERCNRGVATILSKGLFDADETRKHIEAALARQRVLAGPTQRLVRRAMAFIQANYAKALSREEIASHVGISPDYLTDCFRQELGITPTTYLNRYRLLKARGLLENTDLKITQIALAVGFSESAHFTRTFEREVGVSPRAYRQGKRTPAS